jgi:hypothetical protein
MCSGEPGLVTVATNSTIARLALPSFHEGSGSADGVTFGSDGGFMKVLLSSARHRVASTFTSP